MPIQELIFFAFAAALITAALMTILARNPVYSVLFLVMAFFASAGLWIMLEAEFLGLVLVLVYVGAVMTLFLFVVMTLNIDVEIKRVGFMRHLPLGLVIIAVLVGLMIYISGPQHFNVAQFANSTPAPANYSNTSALGMVLYTDYVYPFELAGVLLLVAIIAAIALSFRGQQKRKNIAPEQQINIRREDRIRIVKMAPTKKSS